MKLGDRLNGFIAEDLLKASAEVATFSIVKPARTTYTPSMVAEPVTAFVGQRNGRLLVFACHPPVQSSQRRKSGSGTGELTVHGQTTMECRRRLSLPHAGLAKNGARWRVPCTLQTSTVGHCLRGPRELGQTVPGGNSRRRGNV